VSDQKVLNPLPGTKLRCQPAGLFASATPFFGGLVWITVFRQELRNLLWMIEVNECNAIDRWTPTSESSKIGVKQKSAFEPCANSTAVGPQPKLTHKNRVLAIH
jgi:hypothetical protein